jgi:hypothetical protein
VKEVAMPGENEQRLRDHGIIAQGELPTEYSELIEGLEESEVDALISINEKLIDSGIPLEPVTGRQFIVPL